MITVVFVCMGNICRSPMAEAVFQHLVDEAGLSNHFHVDSAGTIGYHAGEPAHPGTVRILSKHGIGSRSVSRKVNPADFSNANYLIALDRDNYYDMKAMARDFTLDGRLHLLLDFANGVNISEVPDPYYNNNFEYVYGLVEAGCEGLLAHIRREHNI